MKWTGTDDAEGVEAFFNSAAETAATQPEPAKVEVKKEEVKAVVKPVEKKVKAPIRSFANKVWTVENYGQAEVVF